MDVLNEITKPRTVPSTVSRLLGTARLWLVIFVTKATTGGCHTTSQFSENKANEDILAATSVKKDTSGHTSLMTVALNFLSDHPLKRGLLATIVESFVARDGSESEMWWSRKEFERPANSSERRRREKGRNGLHNRK